MPSNSTLFSPRPSAFISSTLNARWFIVSILFIAAFGIRIYHIAEPPLDFHPTRQYRSAIIARGYFFRLQQSPLPDWERNVATINRNREGILEPPIMEVLASSAYRIAGAEYLWIPRTLSVLFWLGGGWFLYALAKGLDLGDGAIFSTIFYLFNPFGISASRSFQPDSLMVLAFLSAVFAILRYYVQPSKTALSIAALLSACAILIKPLCLFAIFSAFIFANVSTNGLRKTLTGSSLFLFGIVSLLPTSLFYFYGIFVGGFLRGQAEGSFIPSLYLSSAYWLGWLKQINTVVGPIALVAAILGVFLFRGGLPRALILGLWIGYAIFGLLFNYHIHTHDYYQMQLIPILALSIAPLGILLFDAITKIYTRWYWRWAIFGALVFALLCYIGEIRWRLRNVDDTHVRIAKEIGRVTQHSTKTVFLTFAYGRPLEYYGEISGREWPRAGDLRLEQLMGKRVLTPKGRLDSLMRSSPTFFIVTDFQEWESQQDLRQYLEGTFPIVTQTRDYIIFNLNK